MINKSFQLLRTNPALTTNIKLVVSSDYKLYLESFDTNSQLSDQKYKHYSLAKNKLYENQIVKFYDGLSSQLAFDVKYDSDNTTVFTKYSQQFDDVYWSGAKSIEDTWYNEEFEYLAPLFIKKNDLPEGFIILRVDGPASYEDENDDLGASKLNKNNFYAQVVDRWKCVSVVDMRYDTDLGLFLNVNFTNNTSFPERSFDLDFRQYEYSKFYGIDYNTGSYVNKSNFLQSILKYEQPHFKLEKEIIKSFRTNNLIFPHILNLKFLFNDVPADQINIKNYSINRYYGFYADKLELISNLTSYISPELKSGYVLRNNIFGVMSESGDTFLVSHESPFVEGFFLDKTYWIQLTSSGTYDNEFYQVIQNYKNGIHTYQILSDIDMSGYTFNSTNDRTCNINYTDGYNYNCQIINNPTSVTNWISGYTSNFNIDPFCSGDTIESMYGDLYLIQIDGIYHVLKYKNNNYFIQSDYAINSYTTGLEYWKGGKNSKYYIKKDIYTYGNKPIIYPIYRIKFSDIKDFDFNRINTHFADFDYEKDKYTTTNDHKLYAVDYTESTDLSKVFMTHPRGEDGQYQVMNVSSEYVSSDELYEISFNNLTDIWRKNQSVTKWGFAGSNSSCDYPYKLNNSLDVGDVFNKTCNVFSILPSEIDKNLDYFYRIGNFFSGSTINNIRYLNQTTNIEVDFMEDYSKKFNLDLYLNSDVDYFDYFFKNKQNFTIDDIDYIKPTVKYSTFQSGDNYSPSNTLFKGLNINALNVKKISRDINGKISTVVVDNSKNFNNYKFAIILNDVYEYYNETYFDSILEGGLSGNTIIDKSTNAIHVFFNEKFNNFLIIINVKIPIQKSHISLNNVSVFGEKFGLYNAKTLDNKTLSYPKVVDNFDPTLIVAANIFDAFEDMNTLSGFDSGITYYYINSDGQSGYTAPMNMTGGTMKDIPNWVKNDPPFILTLNDPKLLETKKKSYIKTAVKGPTTNIYDKYQIYYDDKQKSKYDVSEPLARKMDLNSQGVIMNTSNGISDVNSIYRYNGTYEPIFNNISVFNNTILYLSGETIKSWGSNYKFDTSYESFGRIEELIFSKINPITSPLKLKNTDKDLSLYPIVDEFGYQFGSRFIFNSSWDKDFYIITNNEQNMNKNVFSNYSHVEYIIDPIKSKK